MKGFAMGLVIAAAAAAGAQLPESIAPKAWQSGSLVNFADAVSFQEIPGKPGRYLVIQKGGALLTYEPATGKTGSWLRRTVNSEYEEGVTAAAFHPDFATNSKYYLFYNPQSNGSLPDLNYGHPGRYTSILEERRADAARERDAGTAPVKMGEFCCKDGPGHNGQALLFGQDRMLYVTVGDGNSDGRDTQTRKTFLGTVLRIDVDRPDPGRNYGIPKDNPFYNDTDPAVKKEIWAYGFRQPYKLSLDPLNGDIWVGNVGGWNEDQIYRLRKGANFGWPITEGTVCFDNSKSMFQYTAPLPSCNRTGITPPDIALPHSLPRGNVNTNCVIGPVVYRGNPASPLYGVLFFADYTARKLMAARLGADGKLVEMKEYPRMPFPIVHLMEASDGRILVSGLANRQFFYLDDPGLLPGPSAVRTAARDAMGMASGGARYDAAGKRLGPAQALRGIWGIPNVK